MTDRLSCSTARGGEVTFRPVKTSFTKKQGGGSRTQTLMNAIEAAREQLALAEVELVLAKQRAREAKERRKRAKEVARRAGKQLKKARKVMADAKQKLIKAEDEIAREAQRSGEANQPR